MKKNSKVSAKRKVSAREEFESLRTESPLPEEVREQFVRFVEYHSAKQFGKNLRKMLLEFLMHDSSVESIYLKELLYDLDGLFDLLDAIEEGTDSEILLKDS